MIADNGLRTLCPNEQSTLPCTSLYNEPPVANSLPHSHSLYTLASFITLSFFSDIPPVSQYPILVFSSSTHKAGLHIIKPPHTNTHILQARSYSNTLIFTLLRPYNATYYTILGYSLTNIIPCPTTTLTRDEPMASSSSSYCQRPTLPPLRELNLPMPEARTFPLSSTSSYSHLHHPTPFRPRQVSISSSVTSSSPSPPPFGMKSASPYLSPTETLHTRLTSGHKVRLVPCSLEEAEAVVFVPPPLPHALSRASENIDPRQSPHQQHGSKPQALFLIGSMIERHLRHPSRVISKGARIHPYRAVREGENTPKRMSLNRRATANAEA